MKLWDSFLEMVSDKNNLTDYKTYYSAIVKWTKKHIKLFTDEMIKINSLDFLLNIDINEYVIENPDICLETEYERLKKLSPDTRYISAMLISDILREMITLKSGTDCPNCKSNELSLYPAEMHGIKRNFLMCDLCGWCDIENINI